MISALSALLSFYYPNNKQSTTDIHISSNQNGLSLDLQILLAPWSYFIHINLFIKLFLQNLVHIHARTHVHIHTSIRMHAHVCRCIHTSVHMCVHTYRCVYQCICTYMCVRTHISVYMYVCMYIDVFICVCMYVYMYIFVYMYICAHTCTFGGTPFLYIYEQN